MIAGMTSSRSRRSNTAMDPLIVIGFADICRGIEGASVNDR